MTLPASTKSGLIYSDQAHRIIFNVVSSIHSWSAGGGNFPGIAFRCTLLPGWLMLEQTIPSTFKAKHALLRSTGRLLTDPKRLMLWVLCKFAWTWSSWLAFCSSGMFSLIRIFFIIFFSIQLAPSNSLGILQRFLYASSLIAGDLAS